MFPLKKADSKLIFTCWKELHKQVCFIYISTHIFTEEPAAQKPLQKKNGPHQAHERPGQLCARPAEAAEPHQEVEDEDEGQ